MNDETKPEPKPDEVVRFDFEGWGVYDEGSEPHEPWAIFADERSANQYIEMMRKADEAHHLSAHPINARCAMHNHYAHRDFKKPEPEGWEGGPWA